MEQKFEVRIYSIYIYTVTFDYFMLTVKKIKIVRLTQ